MLGIIAWRTHQQTVEALENHCSMPGIGELAAIRNERPCCGIITIEALSIDRWRTAPLLRVIRWRMEQRADHNAFERQHYIADAG